MPGQHALFSPSSAPRVVPCPRSFRLNLGLNDEASFEAIEGTAAHELHERALVHEQPAETWTGETIRVVEHEGELDEKAFDIEVTPEMADYVQQSVDRCLATPGQMHVETRVNISRWTPIPDQFGTSDVIHIDNRTMYVTDLKYGKGVRVYAEGNEQALLYALGAFDEWSWAYDIEEVVIRINQPRLDHWDEWRITTAELLAHGERIKARFALAMRDDAPYGPSQKACMFCKVKRDCKARLEQISRLVEGAFDDLDADIDNAIESEPARIVPVSVDVASITHEELARIIDLAPSIYSFLKAAKARAMHLIMREGVNVPGLKVVSGRGRYFWLSEDDTIEALTPALGDNVWKRQLRSPSAIKKLLVGKMKPKERNALVAELASKRPGKPTLVPASDPRPAARAEDYSDAFESIDENDDEEAEDDL